MIQEVMEESTQEFNPVASPGRSAGRDARGHHQGADARAALIPELLLRPAAIVALLGLALIHFLDVFSKFKETPYLGVMYVLLIGGCLLAVGLLLRADARPGWSLAALLAATTALGYVLSRTTGLPASSGDIANWSEPLGLASLFVEGLIMAGGAYALRGPRQVHRAAGVPGAGPGTGTDTAGSAAGSSAHEMRLKPLRIPGLTDPPRVGSTTEAEPGA